MQRSGSSAGAPDPLLQLLTLYVGAVFTTTQLARCKQHVGAHSGTAVAKAYWTLVELVTRRGIKMRPILLAECVHRALALACTFDPLIQLQDIADVSERLFIALLGSELGNLGTNWQLGVLRAGRRLDAVSQRPPPLSQGARSCGGARGGGHGSTPRAPRGDSPAAQAAHFRFQASRAFMLFSIDDVLDYAATVGVDARRPACASKRGERGPVRAQRPTRSSTGQRGHTPQQRGGPGSHQRAHDRSKPRGRGERRRRCGQG